MGAFCTRTICNVEKGDENYNKLLNRNINMEKKKPEFESLPSRDVPDNDEQEVAMTPVSPNEQQPKPAYTHSTPNSSMTITVISQTQRSVEMSQSSLQSPSDNYSTDVQHPSAVGGHIQIPTPSIQEIQAAMDNMSAMFTPVTADGMDGNETAMSSNRFSPPRDNITLPTMGDNVSNLHLKLANPFASPIVNEHTPSSYPAMPSIPSHQSIPSGQEINAGLPASPTKITENISTMSQDMLGNNPSAKNAVVTPPNNNNDIAEPAPIEPTIENIFGGQGNSTIVIHDDENESAAGKLTLQLEGSSDQRDETNVVFSPPNISNDKVEEEEEQEQEQEEQQQSQQDINKVDNLQTDKKVADEKSAPKSEILPSIPKMEVSVNENSDIDNENDTVNDNAYNNANDDVISDNDKAELKEETVTESPDDNNDDNNDDDNKNKTENVSNEREEEDKNEEAPKKYLINIENVQEQNEAQQEEEAVQTQTQTQAQTNQEAEEEEAAAVLANVNSNASNATVNIINPRLSATNSNQSEQNEIQETEKRIDGNQQGMKQGMGLMTDPWKSDYETSDIESCDSLDKGEMNDDEEENMDGKKRRQSKTETDDHLAAHHHLALNYEDTTLNDESTTDDEDSPRPGDHSKLYREHSRWKWQEKDINKQAKAMNKQLKKLKAEQEVAEMHNMMQFYRQQSEQLQ